MTDLTRQQLPGLCQCGCGRETTVAAYSDRSKGWVRGEPKKFVKGHKPPRRPGSLYQVDEDTGCWIWVRARNPKGYGIVRHRGPVRFAHRAFYEDHVGPVPDGLELDHLCRNRACVNPAHLEAVTHAENVRRGHAARRVA